MEIAKSSKVLCHIGELQSTCTDSGGSERHWSVCAHFGPSNIEGSAWGYMVCYSHNNNHLYKNVHIDQLIIKNHTWEHYINWRNLVHGYMSPICAGLSHVITLGP